MNRFVSDSHKISDKSLLYKVSVKRIICIKKKAIKKPLLSGKQIFDAAGVSGVLRTSPCRLTVVYKAAFRPALTKAHRDTFLQWV